MGVKYGIECSACDYRLSVMLGVGMMYSPSAVFYGHCDDQTQNWNVAFPAGYRERDKPLLFSLVKSKKIRDKTFELLKNGAIPERGYGHALFMCPKCMRLYNKFYFKLHTEAEDYEPEYTCSKCKTSLQHVDLKETDGGLEIVDTEQNRVEWKCPGCGNNHLAYSLSGWMNWD